MMKEGIPMGYKTVVTVMMVLFTSQLLASVAGQPQPRSEAKAFLLDGQLTWVSLGDKGTMWGVNKDQNIFQFDGARWKQIQGKLVQISVGAMGVWGVNAQNQIWRWDALGKKWDNIPGVLTQVASGAEVWGVNSADQIWKYVPEHNQWTEIGGLLLYQISASDDGRVVGIKRAGTPYEYINGGWIPLAAPSTPLQRITVGAAGVWGTIDSVVVYYEFKWGIGSWRTPSSSLTGGLRWYSLSQIDSGSFDGTPRLAAVTSTSQVYFITFYY